MKTIFLVTLTFIFFCLTSSGTAAKEVAKRRMNVLFIAVDDLRPELGCYGFSQIKSPNIDELAKKGLRFERAYCQYALCNPSRSSLLSGLRPETIQIYDLKEFVRTQMPDIITLPQLFKQNGYESRSIGKIFHVTNGNHDDDISWSTHAWQSPKDDRPQADVENAATRALAPGEDFDPVAKPTVRQNVAQQASAGRTKSGRRKLGAEPYEPRADMLPYESPDVPDNGLLDGQIADKAVSIMNQIKDRPFFLAVGFHKPHMPWIAPKRYWDMYRDDDIHLAEYQQLPVGAPEFASNEAGEFRSYKGIPNEGPIPQSTQREAIHSYYACISYADAQIGRVLAELDRLGLRRNTIIILWGDHGYHLGEHGTWNKRTNWEVAARVPLIISVPGQQHAGEKTSALVELLDMYPTLAQLCHLEPPAAIEGRSFVPLLREPDLKWKNAAFTTYRKPLPDMGTGFGRAMRTDRYRFVEWSGPKSSRKVYELYEEQADPLEKTNLAVLPDNAGLVARLTEQLQARGHE
jgi:iduronate 2-sulfatase